MTGYVVGATYERLLSALPVRQEILQEACRLVCPYCGGSANLRPESKALVELDDDKFGHSLADGRLRICGATPIWKRIRIEFPAG